MATVTAQTIVKTALRKAGDTFASADNQANALVDLNAMIGQWSAESLMVPSITTENFTLSANDGEYSIGSGGDFDTVRPVKIEGAYLKDSNGYDYPLSPMSREAYNAIVDKTTQSRPEQYLYIQSYPLGKILFDYLPDSVYTFYFDSIKPLTEFSTLTATVNLPDEYKMALIYNLVLLIADDLGKPLSPRTIALAVDTKKILKNNNMRLPPLAQFDRALTGGGSFNIYTGQVT